MDCEAIGYDASMCCDSCHEDFENGDDDGCTVEIDGVEYVVCCDAKMWYEGEQ